MQRTWFKSREKRKALQRYKQIQKKTERGNVDNISRTVFYLNYYKKHPEIRWAFLASCVSRNAGWSMTDLCSEPFKVIMDQSYRKLLFATYERANWTIFADAYPQLLLYEQSKKFGSPLFDEMRAFGVSEWMIAEWERFWVEGDEERLCIALIINEQHVIEKPVIQQSFYNKHVFRSIPFKLQDAMHFSTVLFPTISGEVYGASVYDFTNVQARIELGKRLMWILFSSPEKDEIADFSENITHTGSRRDYQMYMSATFPKTPILRVVYPKIRHYRSSQQTDWSEGISKKRLKKQLKSPTPLQRYQLTTWYIEKQEQIRFISSLEKKFTPK
ncbi:DUF2515 family protein [Texcoconibacillus texcoconensis]|uniref:DUF2515 domain-containing protein n=1 Tax=Texcoconibacillus texcoconensis TaxID=1095777 RepID=A0A840QQJ0_9BACI|nr:DUF2515 family protein [Texcoconibacillus texcoconensis]MBB5173593.1 hypothetical protein [Texcoconibacillus texcoconensis]